MNFGQDTKDSMMTERQEALKNMEKPDRPGFIILGTGRESNGFTGSVEHSFSLAIDETRTQFFWSGPAYSFLGRIELDGQVDAEHRLVSLRRDHPDFTWAIFDAHGELPVLIDWDRWRHDKERKSEKLSGVRNKFGHRNPSFFMKDE